mgnify:CR=1 FL=1
MASVGALIKELDLIVGVIHLLYDVVIPHIPDVFLGCSLLNIDGLHDLRHYFRIGKAVRVLEQAHGEYS